MDLIIKGGTVIDGTGSPGRRANVAIKNGSIQAIDESETSAPPGTPEIDATGQVVAPGFIDLHTHYDAQAFWDPTLSPSPLHGVTTVVGGNCGFSIAPLAADAADYLKNMLARVEGMPLESLDQGVPWNWSSFEEYLSRLDGELAVNAGFLVGHSALRRVVMAEAAVGTTADDDQLARMKTLLRESLEAGGLGFSSSYAPTHHDGSGDPVPSRHASREELIELCRTVRDHEGTTLEFIPTVGEFDEATYDLMASMSVAANRPLNWNVLQASSFNKAMVENQLGASDYASKRGAKVLALTLPQVMNLRLNLYSGFVFDALPDWAKVIGLPLEKRCAAFADPATRRHLNERANSEEAGVFRFFAAWEHLVVDQIFDPANSVYQGRTVGDIAKETGKEPFDAMLDLALSEGLRTSFMPQMPGDDDESWQIRADVWRDPRTIIGASDAGAHLDMIDTFTYSTTLLGTGVRERQLLPIEEAIRLITDRPAQIYGLKNRGRIEKGYHADIVIFDPDEIGPGPIHTRNDLPGGAGRLFAEANGIHRVLVNGAEIVRDGTFTSHRPGTILRSGRDTSTVEAAG